VQGAQDTEVKSALALSADGAAITCGAEAEEAEDD
jgi:hypothetical protein